MSTPQQNPNQLLTLPGFSGGNADAQTGGGSTPPWWRRPVGIITIIAVLVVIVLGSLYFTVLARPTPVTYQTSKVTQGDLDLTISATGPLSTTSYSLAYTGTTAKITEIDVKVGQQVTKGQVLAKVDATQLQNQVSQDQTSVNADQIALGNAQAAAGASAQANGQSVTDAQNGLQNAQTNQNNANSLATANVKVAQTSLNNAQKALNNAQNTANTQKKQAAAQRDVAKNSCQTQFGSGSTGTNNPAAPATTGNVTTTNTTSTNNSNNLQDCLNNADAAFNATVASANASVKSAQLSVNSAQAALSQAQANATSSKANASQSVQTAQGQITSAQANANLSGANSASNVNSMQKQMQIDQLRLQQDQVNLANATLTAPHDGVITAINGAVGGLPGASSNGSAATGSANASAASSAGSTFIQLVDLKSLQVNASVNESDTANLKNGDSATFTVNAYGDRQFTGTVSAISPQGQTTSNVVTYPISIDIDPASTKGATLYPNMTANVTVIVVQRKGVMQIPVQAINFARQASNATAAGNAPRLISQLDANAARQIARQKANDLQVQNPDISADNPTPAFVIEQDSKGNFAAHPVVIGLTDGTFYEVLDGLQTDESIITGVGGARPGVGAPGGSGPAGG